MYTSALQKQTQMYRCVDLFLAFFSEYSKNILIGLIFLMDFYNITLAGNTEFKYKHKTESEQFVNDFI